MEVQKNAEEMMADLREKQIVDLRNPEDASRGMLEGSVNLPWETLDSHLSELKKDVPVYLICYTGQTSDEWAERLSEEGYEAYSIRGGYKAVLLWQFQHSRKKQGSSERKSIS